MKGITPEVREKFRATQIRLFGTCYLDNNSNSSDNSPDPAGFQPDKIGNEGSGDNDEKGE